MMFVPYHSSIKLNKSIIRVCRIGGIMSQSTINNVMVISVYINMITKVRCIDAKIRFKIIKLNHYRKYLDISILAQSIVVDSLKKRLMITN
jgi:hypothetical protein